MTDTRCCSSCQRELPLSAFAKDARRKSGVRAICRGCDAKAREDRRRGDRPKPGALVLVPNPPAWRGGHITAPTPTSLPIVPEGPAPGANPGLAGASDGPPSRPGLLSTYADAAEAFIAALEPPAGPADALLVRSLRGLAELADVSEHGDNEWTVRDTTAIVAKLVAVQRELAATRAAKRTPAAQPEAPRRPSAASY